MTVLNAVAWLLLAAVIGLLHRRITQRQGADRQLLQHLSRQQEQLERELADCQEALKAERETTAGLRRECQQQQQQLAALQETFTPWGDRLEALEAKAAAAKAPVQEAPATPVADSVADKILGSFQSPLVKDIMQRLADGTTVQQIARDKGMQVGEVELIKALNKFAPKA
ncbi:hypothetical protein [Acanthopleuribacter pedis]|uniref:DUF2802 domain-containing protein n=1 Tax=Acanthopleuribacter pedis TaxID=442870 RepID=A0A8J7U3Z3_9BACT|nr:hypothetical protein [Acanthopleuribacter pedis]MBO1318823.1 hypothetical protein [Acanthopleuribacter pedis]